MILVDRQGEEFPFTMGELSFLSRHEEEIPATMEKQAKEEAKKQKKNNETNRKKEV